jgi:hypothetical protein
MALALAHSIMIHRRETDVGDKAEIYQMCRMPFDRRDEQQVPIRNTIDRNPTVITPLWGKCFVYCIASCYRKAPALSSLSRRRSRKMVI